METCAKPPTNTLPPGSPNTVAIQLVWQDRVSLSHCSGCPGAQLVDQVGIELLICLSLPGIKGVRLAANQLLNQIFTSHFLSESRAETV